MSDTIRSATVHALGPAAAYSEVRVMLPRNVKFEDCLFYHTVDIPGHGVVRGQWDLRRQVDTYLGGYRFAGKRVLEIGPASGFLTCEMGRRGADVVALEVPDDPGWISFHTLTR